MGVDNVKPSVNDYLIYVWCISFFLLFILILPFEAIKDSITPPLAHVLINNIPGIAEWAWILVAAFLGGYLFMVRGLLRAIYNFDLSPTSFMASSVHLLFGVASAMIIVATAKNLLSNDPIVKGLQVGWRQASLSRHSWPDLFRSWGCVPCCAKVNSRTLSSRIPRSTQFSRDTR